MTTIPLAEQIAALQLCIRDNNDRLYLAEYRRDGKAQAQFTLQRERLLAALATLEAQLRQRTTNDILSPSR